MVRAASKFRNAVRKNEEAHLMIPAAARFAIRSMGLAKRVPQSTVERATRLFMLALEGGTYKSDGSEPKNYVLGRKSEYTQASCLYVACRLDKTNHMLIDFADALSVSLAVHPSPCKEAH